MFCQKALQIGRAASGKMRRYDPEPVQQLGEARLNRGAVVVWYFSHLAIAFVIMQTVSWPSRSRTGRS